MTHSVKAFMQQSVVGLCLFVTGCTGLATKPYSPPAKSARGSTQNSVPAGNASANSKGDPEQRFNAALKLMKDRQTPEAIAAFTSLARDYPEFSGPMTDLAILYAQSRQRPQAIAGLTKAVSTNPRNAVAWNWLGTLYRESGDYPRAEQAYQQALATKFDYAAAHMNLGILYEVSMRRPQEALSQYREYLRLSGKENLIVTAWIKQLEMTAGTTVASGAAP
ncbi:tetratricopeptide repeat protein [Stenotrophobium rhamnosiphilum]|nr:tetratricopeptide repeat protein [Stenotrophobium rhamnosiphilum]